MKSPNTTKELVIDTKTLKEAALIFRAINHKLRQQIINFINNKNLVNVSQIYKKLRLEQSVASQHLAILRQAGFVSTQRDGKQVLYSVNQKKLERARKIAAAIL